MDASPLPLCKCHMETHSQLWSIDKEVWKSEKPQPPQFNTKFAPLHGYACSVSINRNTIVVIGGHYLELKKTANVGGTKDRFVPLEYPLNDNVFEYNFNTLEWTEFPKVPNIQVCCLIFHIKSL